MAQLRDHCLNQNQLQQLLSQQLDQRVESEFMVHMDECRDCQNALQELAASAQVWDELPSNLIGQTHLLHGRPANGAEETSDHEPDSIDTGVQKLIEYLGPTDHPNMLGRIGVYEICGIVGRGGTGIVVKSFEPSLNRYVAIKVLSPTLSSNGAARKRFEREARAIAAVVHEHVVPIFAVDEHQGLPYFVMQYVAGASLQHRIERQGPLDACEVVRIAMQVAHGLAAAHAQGIVHRDIKPANILLEHGLDRVMVSDFGLARVTDGATVTMSGMIAGTPSYMAPEQARGDSIDQRSDLFSLGSVMYAMCTAVPPFQSETIYGVIRRICDAEPRPIRESNPLIPEWLEALTNKLLSKQKEERFESADQVAAILSAELAHLQNPTSVQVPPRPWWQPKKSATRRRSIAKSRLLSAGLGALVALAAVPVAISLNNDTTGDKGQIAISGNGTKLTITKSAGEEQGEPQQLVMALDNRGKLNALQNAVAMAHPLDDIVIDGDLSDWPADMPSYSIERAEVGQPPQSDEDLSSTFRVGYNAKENAIYVGVQVVDDTLVIDPKAGQREWDAQDGCEVYIDRLHLRDGSPLAQYTRYGDSLNAFGSNDGIEGVDLIVGQDSKAGNAQSGHRTYEWRIRLAEGVRIGRSVGLDIAILDKDEDGSFTWLTWASGTQKLWSADRCGDLVFIDRDTPLGTVSGKVNWRERGSEGKHSHARRRVHLQSLEEKELWVTVDCQESGEYAVELPAGRYSVEAATDVDHRVRQAENVNVVVELNELVRAAPVEVSIRMKEELNSAWQEVKDTLADKLGSKGPVQPHKGDHFHIQNYAIASALPLENVTVDGDLSDWPESMPSYAMDDFQLGDQPISEADTNAKFRVGYSVEQQSIYVAVEVEDDSPVFAAPGPRDWATQDGNEVYLDAEHRKTDSHIQQFNFYGRNLVSQPQNVQAAFATTDSKRIYEWQIQTEEVVTAGRSMGFDVSVADRDEDGSFTWLAWGRGSQKAWYNDRCGNLLLVDRETEFGTVTGKVEWKDKSTRPLPRVCLQSLVDPGLRPRVACDAEGNFTAKLPAGKYLIGAIGQSENSISVDVVTDREVQANLLQIGR